MMPSKLLHHLMMSSEEIAHHLVQLIFQELRLLVEFPIKL